MGWQNVQGSGSCVTLRKSLNPKVPRPIWTNKAAWGRIWGRLKWEKGRNGLRFSYAGPGWVNIIRPWSLSGLWDFKSQTWPCIFSFALKYIWLTAPSVNESYDMCDSDQTAHPLSNLRWLPEAFMEPEPSIDWTVMGDDISLLWPKSYEFNFWLERNMFQWKRCYTDTPIYLFF